MKLDSTRQIPCENRVQMKESVLFVQKMLCHICQSWLLKKKLIWFARGITVEKLLTCYYLICETKIISTWSVKLLGTYGWMGWACVCVFLLLHRYHDKSSEKSISQSTFLAAVLVHADCLFFNFPLLTSPCTPSYPLVPAIFCAPSCSFFSH